MDRKQRSILKDSLKAPEALSLRYMPFFIVITFPFLLIIDNVWKLPSQDQLRLTLAKTIGYGFLYLYFLFIKITCNSRQSRSLSIPIHFFLSGLGGAFQGIVGGFLIQLFGVQTQISISERSLTAFFVALTWLPINAVASSAISTFRKNRAEFLRRSEQMGRIAFNQAGLAKNIRSQIERDIVDELNWTREYAHSKFERSLDVGIDTTLMNSQFIREYASQDLRAISHKLWNQAEAKSRAILPKKTSEIRSIWELYRMSFYLPPVDSFIQAFIFLTLFLPISLRGYPLHSQLEVVSIFAIVVFGVLRLGYLLYRKFPDKSPIIIPLRTFSALGLSYTLAIVLNNEVAKDLPLIPLPALISAIMIFISVDVAMSIAKSTLYSQEEQIRALHRSIGSQKAQINLANLELALVSREWAQHIHGTLASKLLTSAAILENTVANNDLAAKEEAIAEATLILNGDFFPPQSAKRDLAQEILHRVHQWTPILNIELHFSMDLNFPTIPVEKFGLAIEEALANAYRHGQATKVSVLLNPLDSQLLECTITDNGVGLSGYKRDGLGSALFEAIAPGNWSRELGADGVGTRLRLLVSAPNNPSVGDI